MRSVTTIESGFCDEVSWKVAERSVAPELAPYVLRLVGYRERSATVLRRRELPAPQAVVILELGPPIRVFESGQAERWDRYPGGFVAGIDERFSLTEFCGEQRGLELKLTPIGARLLFGIPMSELAGRVLPLELVLPGAAALMAQLAECRSWDARFELIEALLRSRLLAGSPRTQLVNWAFQRILASGGCVDVAALARELGYSHKHVVTLFRDQVGLAPKLAARLVRFDRLVRELREGGRTWAALSAELGFADQAHLVREVRHFAGVTPSELSTLVVPTGLEDSSA